MVEHRGADSRGRVTAESIHRRRVCARCRRINPYIIQCTVWCRRWERTHDRACQPCHQGFQVHTRPFCPPPLSMMPTYGAPHSAMLHSDDVIMVDVIMVAACVLPCPDTTLFECRLLSVHVCISVREHSLLYGRGDGWWFGKINRCKKKRPPHPLHDTVGKFLPPSPMF